MNRSARTRNVLLAVVLLSTTGGCSDDNRPPYCQGCVCYGCDDDSDCNEGLSCLPFTQTGFGTDSYRCAPPGEDTTCHLSGASSTFGMIDDGPNQKDVLYQRPAARLGDQ